MALNTQAKEAGADVLFVKKEWTAAALSSATKQDDKAAAEPSRSSGSRVIPDPALVAYMQDIKYATGGDD